MTTQAPPPNLRYELKPLAVADLVDYDNRTFQEAHARYLMSRWDRDLMDPLWVNYRDGRYLLFSGQHRAWVLKQLDNAKAKALCRVYTDLSDQEMARLFISSHDTLNLTALDRFLKQVKSGDQNARVIVTIVESRGLRIEKQKGPGVVQCVAACGEILRKAGGAKVLGQVFALIFQIWGKSESAYHASIVRGLAAVLFKHGKVEDGGLRAALGQFHNPLDLVDAGRSYATAAGVSAPRGVAQWILKKYNKGRKKRLSME